MTKTHRDHPPAEVERLLDDRIFTVTDFLDAEECDALIARSEAVGFEPATVHTAAGHVHRPDWRNNTRVTLDDVDGARWLWSRAEAVVPALVEDCRAIGVNERLRTYRYDAGQQFDWHTDGFHRRSRQVRSFYTFMVYLNEGFVGGETSFSLIPTDTPTADLQVVPRKGMALFFLHPLAHKGEPVREGRKYVLRTDVMYEAGR